MPKTRFFEEAPADFLESESEKNHPTRKLILEETLKVGGKSVLDVGCNVCMDYPIMTGAGIDYTGIDFSEQFLKRARDLHPAVRVALLDITKLRVEMFSGMFFDVVYEKDVLEHLSPGDYENVIRSMWGLCRKLMILVFFHVGPEEKVHFHAAGFWENYYSKEKVEKILRSLEDFKEFSVMENVGYRTVYVVRRKGRNRHKRDR